MGHHPLNGRLDSQAGESLLPTPARRCFGLLNDESISRRRDEEHQARHQDQPDPLTGDQGRRPLAALSPPSLAI